MRLLFLRMRLLVNDKYYYYDYNEGFKLDLSLDNQLSISWINLESFLIIL